MNLIFNVLGTPSDDDMRFITNPKARNYIKSLKKRPPKPFKQIYKNATDAATDLMEKMLQFNPSRRISVDEALKHPYFKSLHNPKKEVECKDQFDFSFEKEKMTPESLRDFMWDEIFQFRPELKDQADALKTKERAVRKQLLAYGAAQAPAQQGAGAAPAPGGGAPAPSAAQQAAAPPPKPAGSTPTPASTPVHGKPA